jgi:UDP-3-O-[3-hydroxymyristoyl] N-acetylglucosamine deacetylase
MLELSVNSSIVKNYTNEGLPSKEVVSAVLKQTTLSCAFTCEGIGVHGAQPVTMTVHPAPSNTGYRFKRIDIAGSRNQIQARFDAVTQTTMNTQLTNASGVSISTVEHLLAALVASGVDNAIIEIDGPEVPIMDGSSKVFMELINKAGVKVLRSPKKVLKLINEVELRTNNGFVRLIPAQRSSFKVSFDFSKRLPHLFSYTFIPSKDSFADLIAPARTFGFYEDAQKVWAMGLAKGTSLDNSIILKDGKVMNEEGLRFKDEYVRHKILDAMGDLALSGYTLMVGYEAHNPSHGLNNQLLRELFSKKESFELLG